MRVRPEPEEVPGFTGQSQSLDMSRLIHTSPYLYNVTQPIATYRTAPSRVWVPGTQPPHFLYHWLHSATYSYLFTI